MIIHHLNCGCMCPVGGPLFDGFSSGLTAKLACHCLLIETENEGLMLVDTGFGVKDMQYPERRLSRFFRTLNRIQYDTKLTAAHQVEELGFMRRDVRHIVLTHLDFDHAGGLEDFPEASVHVMQSERDFTARASGFIGRRRYSPQQMDGIKHWYLYHGDGEPWHGFTTVRALNGLPPEILMVPMPGHTPGHAAVAVRQNSGWILHAGDAYFYRHEMDKPPRGTPGLNFYQRMMETGHDERLENQDRLRRLANDQTAHTRILCSHDMEEFKHFAEESAAQAG